MQFLDFQISGWSSPKLPLRLPSNLYDLSLTGHVISLHISPEASVFRFPAAKTGLNYTRISNFKQARKLGCGVDSEICFKENYED